jgi:hypothetical protein
MRAIFVDQNPVLGIVPGPGRLARLGDELWLAGGGRGESALWRFADGRWKAWSIGAHGLRDILPVDADTAIVCGEHGYVARVHLDDEPEVIVTGVRECLFALARDSTGAIWIGGDRGQLMRLAGARLDNLRDGEMRIARLVGHDGVLWAATGGGLATIDASGKLAIVQPTPAPLTDLAFAPDGTRAVTGDAGQLYLGTAAVTGAPSIDLEAIAFHRDAFVVAGAGGWLGTLARDGTVVALAAATPAYSLTSVVPYADGVVSTGWRQTGAPYRMRGALYFDGGSDLAAVHVPPAQTLPARRVRSFEPAGPALGVDDGIDLAFAEAQARLPGVSWPESMLERVRFYDGDVHVADSDALLASNNRSGYAVAIRGPRGRWRPRCSRRQGRLRQRARRRRQRVGRVGDLPLRHQGGDRRRVRGRERDRVLARRRRRHAVGRRDPRAGARVQPVLPQARREPARRVLYR